MFSGPIKALAGLALSAVALNAAALPLSDYNLILFEDYNFTGGDVVGSSFIGGNLNASGYSVTFGDDVFVVGDVNAGGINLNNGANLTYGGSENTGHINRNGGGVVAQDPSLSLGSLQSELTGASGWYSSLGANGNFAGSDLLYSGSDSLAVFDVSATDIFKQNNSLKMFAGSAETVVINVSGANIAADGGVNLTGNGFGKDANADNLGARNILWNFYEAESIDFGNLAMVGSVLAPYASLTGGGGAFDGSVAAKSYTGYLEFHDYTFVPPTTNVPESGSLVLLLMSGLMLIFARVRLRR